MILLRRHRHEWDATAVQHYEIGRWFPESGAERILGLQTKVLRVCISCGKRDVETLEGKWTLEQVRGLMAPTPVHTTP